MPKTTNKKKCQRRDKTARTGARRSVPGDSKTPGTQPSSSGPRPDPEAHLRDLLAPHRVAYALRPYFPPQGNTTAESPTRVDLNMCGLAAWCVAGFRLFSKPVVPSILETTVEARHVATVLAMIHAKGNISHAAATLGTSRRCVRDILRMMQLYPWPAYRDSEEK